MPSPTPDAAFERPFPALAPAQRYHLDVNGYVVVPDVFTRDECATLRDAMIRLRSDLLAADPSGNAAVRGARLVLNKPHHCFIGPLLYADPVLAGYATNPRIVGLAEELIGGEARLVEFNGHLNRRDPDDDLSKPFQYGFHNGADVPFFTHTVNGLFHCSFVKTLTALTDIGPDDGGTVVVAGSHKIDLPVSQIRDLTLADPSLLHTMVAPAGSTLLFAETLVHATGRIRSDRQRAIIIGGFGSRLFPWWDGPPMDADFAARVPSRYQTLLLGKANWTRGPRYRTLTKPADERRFPLEPWPA